MKKVTKVFLVIIGLCIFIWLIIFAINYFRCEKLKEPIFMEAVSIRTVNVNTGLSPSNYYGLGYKIETEGKSNMIYESKMYLFGILIKEATR